LNFGLAKKYNGKCNLRFDDTNPAKEEDEYVNSIIEDVKWLGFQWNGIYYASDYFEQMYEFAIELIKKGKAYVDDQTAEEIRKNRGTLTEPGVNSPFRDRSVEENVEIFQKMRNGEFDDGSKVLRAKIDMASPNINLRDPVMYRILNASHHRTGDKWHIYPMYDWAHGLEDSIEEITHSICTLEFEDHRPLYDWFLKELNVYHPQQIEFARLNLNRTIMSKRKLLKLVKENYVSGWDDPRMPTLSGLRRRGFTAQTIRNFSDKVGVAKSNSIADYALLEHTLREDLNQSALRVMAVLRPLKVTITNYPDDKVEWMDAVNNPEDESAGSRKIPFSKVLYVEKDDYKEDAPRKWFRFTLGREVRLKHGYYLTCDEAIKNENGEVVELKCSYDPNSKGGWTNDGRKVKGTLHWVSAQHAIKAEVRLYDSLFNVENPDKTESGKDFTANINPNSLVVNKDALIEPGLAKSKAGEHFQFLRLGYFVADLKDHTPQTPVFNRTVTLRDAWARVSKQK
jgi:glutaminyl-tRNA synthetase